jgi:hypothetical protein
MTTKKRNTGLFKGGILVALALAFMAPAHGAGVFRVDAASTAATPDGQSWDTAYPTLQAATDAASTAGGGELWVKAGRYTFAASEGSVLSMKEGVDLYGGFTGSETDRAQRNWAANTTLISGENHASCVIGADSATLDGCTVAFGTAPWGGGMFGGTAVNCFFTGNSAVDTYLTGFGGAIYNGTATNCTFTANTAVYGGGIAGGTATNCIFIRNAATNGGGVSNSTVVNCTFTGNTATNGGGMYDSTALNCTFTGNTANSGGGTYNGTAVNCTFSGNTAINSGGMDGGTALNCTFSGNTATSSGGGMSKGTATNCIFWGDVALSNPELFLMSSVSYSCIQGGYAGAGNSVAYPMFVGAPGNLRLLPGSPCFDTGTDAGAPGTDIIGTERPQGAGVDMGAYENAAYGPSAPTVGATAPVTNPPTWTWTPGGGEGIGQYRFGYAEGMWEESDAATLFYTPPVPLSAGSHTLYVQERDATGNWSASGTHTLAAADTTPPTGTIVINNNASTTTSAGVALTLTWDDGINGSGVTRMRFSNDGKTWSPWEVQASMKPWTLAVGAGYKTVRVQFMDRSGNRSAVYSDYIKVVAP